MVSDPKNKKFLFDLHNFDEDEEAKNRQEKKPAAPPPPTFSLDDMEMARKQAFEKGKEEGARIAKESIEQRTELLVQSLAQNFAVLDAQEEARNRRFVDDSVLIVYNALKASLPTLLAEAAESEIKAALAAFFASSSRSATQYKVFVHADMQDAIAKYAPQLHPSLSIEIDNTLPVSGSRIEWASGLAEWSPEKTVAQILGIIRPFIKQGSEIVDDSTKKSHNEPITPNGNAEETAPSHQDGDS